jgi:membrane peptidoglycan carboxypeptidase
VAFWQKNRGKMLAGAPRKTRLPRAPLDRSERQRRAALVVLGLMALMGMAGAGTAAMIEQSRLRHGLLAQRETMRRRGDWVSITELPPHVPAAFLAVVDTESFTRRDGAPEENGPSLSSDLVRQVHQLDSAASGSARELLMAPLLERSLSRQALLELYLNRIYLGSSGEWRVYGVARAARDYFGKDARRLSLGEAATLAGILLPPELPAPETTPGAVGARRNEVLRRMVIAGTVELSAARAAAAEPLAFQPGADYAPMSRPLDWKQEPPVIRLPPELRPTSPDSSQAQR